MTGRSFYCAPLALIALAACATPTASPPPPDATAIRTALAKEVAKFGPLLQAKDVAGVVSVFTPDATWVLSDASTFVGKDAITTGAKGFFDAVDSFTFESAAVDKVIVVNDSEAVSFSHAIGMIKMKGAKKAERHNNPFVDYWKKGADGSWKVAYEVNADGVIPDPKNEGVKK